MKCHWDGRKNIRSYNIDGRAVSSQLQNVYSIWSCVSNQSRPFLFFFLASFHYVFTTREEEEVEKNLRNRNTVYICSFIFFFSRPNSAGTGLYSDVS